MRADKGPKSRKRVKSYLGDFPLSYLLPVACRWLDRVHQVPGVKKHFAGIQVHRVRHPSHSSKKRETRKKIKTRQGGKQPKRTGAEKNSAKPQLLLRGDERGSLQHPRKTHSSVNPTCFDYCLSRGETTAVADSFVPKTTHKKK